MTLINKEMTNNNLHTATLGGGCFWCTEAIFQEIRGVEKVVSGYTGGHSEDAPTYREVCSGQTGYAEVVQITFDAQEISYSDILSIFMTTHDPTTLNQQGADRGTQYRSVIYYHNNDQKETAEMVIKELSSYFENPIVTEVSPAVKFYKAEIEQQDYYKNNQEQGYCSFVITPKIMNLRKMHSQFLKKTKV